MKKEELRVGNFIDYEGEHLPVTSIHSDNTIRVLKNDYEVVYLRMNQVKPIPITEKFLTNRGGVKYDKLISFDISFFGINEYKKLVIDVSTKRIAIKCGKETNPRDQDDLITIFNGDVQKGFDVHYIQNLYFLLTGKELKR